jgi:thiol reductant ABC exporter CydD subunit
MIAGLERAAGRRAADGRPALDRWLERSDPLVWRFGVLAIIAGVVAAVAAIAAAALLAGVIVQVTDGASPEAVAPALVLLAALAVSRGVGLGLMELLGQHGAGIATGRLRGALVAALGHARPAEPAGADREERIGSLASLATDGIDAVEAYLTSFAPARALAVVVPVLVLLAVAVADLPTVLVLLLTGPVLVLLLWAIGSRARGLTDRRFAELRWMNGLFLDLLRGLGTLRLFGRSVELGDTIRETSRRSGETTMDVLRTAFQTALVLEWSAAVAMAVIAVEVSLRLMTGGIDFGRALFVLIVTPEFFAPLRGLAIRYHTGSAGRTAAAAIRDVTGLAAGSSTGPAGESVVSGRPEAPQRSAPPESAGPPTIAVREVGFAYPDRASILDDLSLELSPRGLIVLAGASGAGKSTLVALLLGLETPRTGVLMVDGVALGDLDPRAWRSRIGWLPQRSHLLEGTVADNLRLGAPDASDDRLLTAARLADAEGLIQALPGGLGTRVGEDGQGLSGGQRQRLALARAFVRDADLYLLDEPTAQLDALSEAVIIESLRTLAGRSTVLVATHRRAIIEAADRVIALAGGRIIEDGSPGELLARASRLRELTEAEDLGS